MRDLLASIEAELNATVIEQQHSPPNISLVSKKIQLRELAMAYIKLERKFKFITGVTPEDQD